jgi:hypothetical protein
VGIERDGRGSVFLCDQAPAGGRVFGGGLEGGGSLGALSGRRVSSREDRAAGLSPSNHDSACGLHIAIGKIESREK